MSDLILEHDFDEYRCCINCSVSEEFVNHYQSDCNITVLERIEKEEIFPDNDRDDLVRRSIGVIAFGAILKDSNSWKFLSNLAKDNIERKYGNIKKLIRYYLSNEDVVEIECHPYSEVVRRSLANKLDQVKLPTGFDRMGFSLLREFVLELEKIPDDEKLPELEPFVYGHREYLPVKTLELQKEYSYKFLEFNDTNVDLSNKDEELPSKIINLTIMIFGILPMFIIGFEKILSSAEGIEFLIELVIAIATVNVLVIYINHKRRKINKLKDRMNEIIEEISNSGHSITFDGKSIIRRGQIAVEPSATTSDIEFCVDLNRASSAQIDFGNLANGLEKLRLKLKESANSSDPNTDIDIGKVAAAEAAAKESDANGVRSNLNQVGAWVFEIATSIGVDITAVALEEAVEEKLDP